MNESNVIRQVLAATIVGVLVSCASAPIFVDPKIEKVPECDDIPEINVDEIACLKLDVYLRFRKMEDIYIKCLNERGAVIDPNYMPLE